LLGLVVLTLGILYLFDATGTLDAGEAVDDWWPAVIVAMGLFQLIEEPQKPARPLIVTGIGIALLLGTAGLLDSDYVWPLVLIVVGLGIITRMHSRPLAPSARHSDLIRASGVFSGATVASHSSAFRGAALTAVFGGAKLDLRAATPAPEGAQINATAVFGGIDVIVPRGWNVTVSGTPILGGVEDKTDCAEALPADAPILTVDGLAVFGGVEVKHADEDRG
jgi:hypothetical protein